MGLQGFKKLGVDVKSTSFNIINIYIYIYQYNISFPPRWVHSCAFYVSASRQIRWSNLCAHSPLFLLRATPNVAIPLGRGFAKGLPVKLRHVFQLISSTSGGCCGLGCNTFFANWVWKRFVKWCSKVCQITPHWKRYIYVYSHEFTHVGDNP